MKDSDIFIELDSYAVYHHGDVVRGNIVVSLDEPISVAKILVVLECDKEVQVTTRNAASEFHETCCKICYKGAVNYFTHSQTVFPDSRALGQLPILCTPEKALSDYDIGFKLGRGSHTFRFECEIPDRVPSTVLVDCENYIRWKVRARVETLFTTNVAQRFIGIRVHRRPTFVQNLEPNSFQSRPVSVKVYLSSYSAAIHTFKGYMDNLFCIETEHKRHGQIVIQVTVPKIGFPQSPNQPLHLGLKIESRDLSLLLLHGITLSLLRKVRVSFETEGHCKEPSSESKDHRDKITLFERKNLDQPLAKALESFQSSLDNARLPHYISASQNSEGFEVTYDLQVVLVLAPKYKPRHLETKTFCARSIRVFSYKQRDGESELVTKAALSQAEDR